MEKELENKLNSIEADIKAIKSDVAVNKTNIQEGFEEAKKERAELKIRINDTYNAVDGFVKVVTKLEQEFTIAVKFLYAMVISICDINIVTVIDRYCKRCIKLTIS